MPSLGSITFLLALLAEIVGISCAAHALLHKRRNSASTLAWIVVCVVLPGLGAFFYLTIGQDRIGRRRTFRLRLARARFRTRRTSRRPGDQADSRSSDTHEALAGRATTEGNQVGFFGEAEEFYRDLIQSIGEARHAIALQFYIFDDDSVGRSVRDALCERACAGVAVRVLYDAVGCASVDASFFKPLTLAGAVVSPFMPMRPLRRRWQINLRNHRKLVIIDGRSAYQGSLNISARHLTRSGGTSLDLGWRLSGPVVGELLEAFASDWFYANGEDVHDLPWETSEPSGSERILVVTSGPDQDHGRFHRLLLQTLYRAESEVTLFTPYFVPDSSLTDAIVVAARRGVNVRLCVPERSDHRLVGWAMRDHLRHAVESGVKVLLHPPPMIHVKAAVIDRSLVLLGSSNLDSRSLFLNFETDLVLSAGPATAGLLTWLDRELAVAKKLSPFHEGKRGLLLILAQRLAALFSPIL